MGLFRDVEAVESTPALSHTAVVSVQLRAWLASALVPISNTGRGQADSKAAAQCPAQLATARGVVYRALMRRYVLLGGIGLAVGLGCTLLEPYPGGGTASRALADAVGPTGGSPLLEGLPQDPLVDPAIDGSIRVTSNAADHTIVAIPGESFVVDLNFVAERGNVLGGGIQFPDSDRVQWTLIDSLRGATGGNIRFAYAVPGDICDGVANLCHEFVTRQFAVGTNITPGTDIDGDGEADGQYVVSPPAEVRVVLKCASCESASCADALPDGACLTCGQPEDCTDAYELCFAPGRPKYETDEGRQFVAFFGIDGLAWKGQASCAAGTALCADALGTAVAECMMPDDTDDATTTDTE